VSFKSQRSFLDELDRRGDLRRIRVEVDPEHEITEIVCRVVREEGPALLFERVKGSSFPLAVNVLGARRRIEWALGRHPGELGQELYHLAQRINPPTLSRVFENRKSIWRALSMRTRKTRRGPCQDVVETPNLDRLPVLKCWPEDAGRFFTLGLVLTRDPESKAGNLGIYRMQVFGPDRTGMHWQIMKGGGYHYHRAEQQNQPLDVAVVVGTDPALLLAAVAPLPEGFDEVAFAGLLRGRATEVTPGRTVDLQVPAHADFILEGQVPPHERHPEGPFGDHFGHYSHRSPFPVFHIKTITRRRNAIFTASIVGQPPQEDRYLGDAVQDMTGPLLKLIHPEVRDLWAYYEAGFHNLLVVAVEERYEKEALKTALGLFGTGQLALTKTIVLVSAGTDVRSFDAVLDSIRKHFDPAEDFLLLPGVPLDTLDFTSFKLNLGSKMILDATSKGQAPESGRHRSIDPRALDRRVRSYQVLGDTMLVVQVDEESRDVVQYLVTRPELKPLKVIAAVSPDIDLHDREQLLWGIFTRFDAARDIVFAESSLRGAWPVHRGCLGIDASFKPGYPNAIVMDPDVAERVNRRWGEYGID
jgi:4-hydroxy-3-polyprenylbenzoate decarboxylase